MRRASARDYTVSWFLGENLSNFVPPAWKLDNPSYHIEDDENVASEQSCAPTNDPLCSPHIWVFNDIETTIRARKCRNPCRILKWIIHLVFKLIQLISLIGAWVMIVGSIVGAFFGIGYLFYLGTAISVIAGIIGMILVLIIVGKAGGCNYFMDTSS